MANPFRTFVVQDDEIKGKKLVAARELEVGSEVLAEQPFASVLKKEFWKSRCYHCFAVLSNVACCAACKQVAYCNRACQKAGWKQHKNECPELKSATRAESDVDVFMARLVLASCLSSPQQQEQFRSLVSHSDTLSPQLLADVAQQVPVIQKLVGSANVDETRSTLEPSVFGKEIYARSMCNSITIWTDTLERVGMGLYVQASRLNHSCQPNCWTCFHGNNLFVRTLRKIQPEEELTISYIDLCTHYAARQQMLQEQYHFTCACARCTNERDNSSNNNSSNVPAELVTQAHATLRAADEMANEETRIAQAIQLLLQLQQQLQQLPQVQNNNSSNDWVAVTNTKLYKKLEQLYTAQGKWQEARDACKVALEWMRNTVYGPISIHPDVVLQLVSLGKLEFKLKNYADSLKLLRGAIMVMSLTYGEEGGKEIKGTVSEFVSLVQQLQNKK